jgi:GntR family transcriptional regulator of gluconate operon
VLPVPPVDFGPVRRQSVPEQVAAAIRAKIFSGELLPGGRLREVELAEKLDVSRGVLREAFRLLAGEQLLVTHPHRGTFVWQPTRQELWELFTLRAGIEGMSARILILGGSRDAAVVELTAIVSAMAQVESVGESAKALDWRFHDTIIRMGANRQILRIWESKSPSVWTASLPAFDSASVPPLSVFHQPILETIAHGTAVDAQEAVVTHVLEGLRLSTGLRDQTLSEGNEELLHGRTRTSGIGEISSVPVGRPPMARDFLSSDFL